MPNHIRWSVIAAMACAIGCGTEEPPPPPAPPLATAPPLTVSGPDSLLGLLRLGTVADGSGLLPGPMQLRAAPSDSADTLVTVTRWQDVEGNHWHSLQYHFFLRLQ